MKNNRGFPVITILLAALVAPAASWGDGVCYKGIRDTTPGERVRMVANLEAVKRALPPAPAGWVLVGDDQVSVLNSLCMDIERKPWNYQFSRSYTSVDDQPQRQALIRQAADIMAAEQARIQPLLDKNMARGEQIVKRQVALMEKGEMEAALALNEQIAAMQEETRKVMEEGDANERRDALLRQASIDQHMYVTVQVNAWSASPPEEGATALPLPPGASFASRWSRSNDVPTDEVQILYGRWRPLSHGGHGIVSRSDVPANHAHSLLVTVTADPGRIESVLAGINFDELAKVLAP